MLKFLSRLLSGTREVKVIIEPVKPKHYMTDSDYHAVREIVRSLSAEGKYFSFCPDDNTLIWHLGVRGKWQRDDDGSRFLEFARQAASPRHAELALEYFKRSCFNSHIGSELKAKRLSTEKPRSG